MSVDRKAIRVITKRVIDIVVSAAALIFLSPVILVTAAIVRIILGRPIFFSQSRPGLNGHIFLLRKFRTMRNLNPSKGLVTDEQRMTKFGLKLRATSLDELPTLVNVLKGDMSLVGPRPLLVEYLDHYTDEWARRHDVRPGITGYAQVNGRNALTWPQKLDLDIYYVANQSLRLDLWILRRTIRTVLSRDGITSAGSVAGTSFIHSHTTEARE